MNLAVLISTASAATAVALGLLTLLVSRARSWRPLRWFSGVSFASAGYAMGNVATSAGLSGATVVRFSRVQTASAVLLLWFWLGLIDWLVERRPGPWERRARLASLPAAALALVPGLAFGGRVVDRAFEPWGIVYRDAIPTAFGAFLFFAPLLGGLVAVGRLWRARTVVRHGTLVTGAFALMIALGTSDALGATLIVNTPYLLDVGFLLPVGAMAFAAAVRFADDSEALGQLRGRLEALVQERTQALTQALDALHQSEKLAALGQFAAGVAHEVNNPASVVVSNLHYVAETAAEAGAPAETRAAIGEALEAMQRINGLVRKLVDAGRLARSPASGDRAGLLQVARAAVDEARLRTGDRVAFSIGVAPTDQVAVRTEVLHQVLSSLLLNACDAIPAGRTGCIEVRAAPGEGGQVRITVSDDGLGMSEEVRRRAFEPFFTTRGEGRGSGLGLPVARALVESHGGDLTLESEPGRGTRAVLSLPEARAAVG